MIGELVTVNGKVCAQAEFYFPHHGAWSFEAELDYDELTGVSPGLVAIVVGDKTFSGTAVEVGSGSFMDRKLVRVVGGHGGWSKVVKSKSYDRSVVPVDRSAVATDLAAAVGEVIVPTPGPVGFSLVRAAEPAYGLLDRLYPDGWYVDDFGVTQTAPRVPFVVNPLAAQLLEYDPMTKRAKFATDGTFDVLPGATVVDIRLSEPFVAHDVWIRLGKSKIEVEATGDVGGDLVDLIRLASKDNEIKFHGIYRYRVIKSSLEGDDLDLQRVSSIDSLPNLIPCRQWPGIGGSRTVPSMGSEVIVSFLDGDRTQPFVLGFAPVVAGGNAPPRVEVQGALIVLEGNVDVTGDLTTGSDPSVSDALALSQKRFARWGDPCLFSAPGPGTLTPAPGSGFSRARGDG